jgi:HupE/UreJ protein
VTWLRFVVALLAAVAIVAACAAPALAHEIRPAYLEMREVAGGDFRVTWKVPARGEYRLALDPELPAGTTMLSPVETRATDDALVRTWTVRVPGSLRGRTVRVRGLEATMTDALFRVEFADGTAFARVLRPSEPSAEVPAAQGLLAAAATYLGLGFDHIVFAADHLLFVLGLLLLVGSVRTLAATVTSFTVAHSLTLAAATLGWVAVPAAPVEAAIALSIFFLGPEIARTWRGETSLTIRHPWVVAFAFGLIHGFGFAGAMTATGLPRAAIPPALLFFNLGVEAGQLAFVLLVLALRRALARAPFAWPVWARRLPGYAVGSLGAFWMIDRTLALVGGGR